MATIIKHDSPHHQSGDAVRSAAYDLSDFASQADDYLGDIQAKAKRIVQEAQQEADRIRKKAEEDGRKAAEAAIEKILDEKVAKQMTTLTPALETAVKQITDSRQQWLSHWESSAIQLACSMASRIIRQEIKDKPEIPQEWIEEALRLSSGAGEISIHLHPTDHSTLGNQVSHLAEVFHPAAPAQIVADESISLGGCRVETQFGTIDQQIETQLARIAQELE